MYTDYTSGANKVNHTLASAKSLLLGTNPNRKACNVQVIGCISESHNLTFTLRYQTGNADFYLVKVVPHDDENIAWLFGFTDPEIDQAWSVRVVARDFLGGLIRQPEHRTLFISKTWNATPSWGQGVLFASRSYSDYPPFQVGSFSYIIREDSSICSIAQVFIFLEQKFLAEI